MDDTLCDEMIMLIRIKRILDPSFSHVDCLFILCLSEIGQLIKLQTSPVRLLCLQTFTIFLGGHRCHLQKLRKEWNKSFLNKRLQTEKSFHNKVI